jgi:hypothetical protein
MMTSGLLCFLVAFGVSFLVMRCAKPKMVLHKDKKGKEVVDDWKAAGLSALAAVIVCVVAGMVSKGRSPVAGGSAFAL